MTENKHGAGTARSLLARKYGETAAIPRDCPWIEPPDAWFDQGHGLKEWGELLTEQWEVVCARPKSRADRQRDRMLEAAGRTLAQEMSDVAIAVLTEKSP